MVLEQKNEEKINNLVFIKISSLFLVTISYAILSNFFLFRIAKKCFYRWSKKNRQPETDYGEQTNEKKLLMETLTRILLNSRSRRK
jgi:high-affinity nickel permease